MARGRGRREYPQVPINLGQVALALGDAGVFGDTATTAQNKQNLKLSAQEQSIADGKLGDAFFRSGGQQEQLTGSAEGFITREQAGSIIRNSPELAKALQNQVERGSLGNIVNNAEALKRLSDAFIGQQEAQASTSLNTYNFGTGEFLVPGSPGGTTLGPDGKTIVSTPATLPKSIPKAPKLKGLEDFGKYIGAGGNLALEGRARVSEAPSVDPSLIDPTATFKVPPNSNFPEIPPGSLAQFTGGIAGEVSPLFPETFKQFPGALRETLGEAKGLYDTYQNILRRPFEDPKALGQGIARFGLGALGIQPIPPPANSLPSGITNNIPVAPIQSPTNSAVAFPREGAQLTPEQLRQIMQLLGR